MLYSNWQHLANSLEVQWLASLQGLDSVLGQGTKILQVAQHIPPRAPPPPRPPPTTPPPLPPKKRAMDIIFKKQYDRCCWPGNYGKGINTMSEVTFSFFASTVFLWRSVILQSWVPYKVSLLFSRYPSPLELPKVSPQMALSSSSSIFLAY